MERCIRLENSVSLAVPKNYTNHVNVYASPFDVVLEAGVKGPPGDEVRLHTALVMSPQMAKVVAQLLAATIRQWEAKHGEISLPGQITRGPGGPGDPGGPVQPS